MFCAFLSFLYFNPLDLSLKVFPLLAAFNQYIEEVFVNYKTGELYSAASTYNSYYDTALFSSLSLYSSSVGPVTDLFVEGFTILANIISFLPEVLVKSFTYTVQSVDVTANFMYNTNWFLDCFEGFRISSYVESLRGDSFLYVFFFEYCYDRSPSFSIIPLHEALLRAFGVSPFFFTSSNLVHATNHKFIRISDSSFVFLDSGVILSGSSAKAPALFFFDVNDTIPFFNTLLFVLPDSGTVGFIHRLVDFFNLPLIGYYLVYYLNVLVNTMYCIIVMLWIIFIFLVKYCLIFLLNLFIILPCQILYRVLPCGEWGTIFILSFHVSLFFIEHGLIFITYFFLFFGELFQAFLDDFLTYYNACSCVYSWNYVLILKTLRVMFFFDEILFFYYSCVFTLKTIFDFVMWYLFYIWWLITTPLYYIIYIVWNFFYLIFIFIYYLCSFIWLLLSGRLFDNISEIIGECASWLSEYICNKLVHFWFILASEPFFLIFFCFFIFTSVLSLFLFFFLGIYGVFHFNFVALVLFLTSVLNTWFVFLFDPKKTFIINLGQWIPISFKTKIDFLIYVDLLSFSFVLLTVTIASFAYLYAFSYFRYEPHADRLLIFLNLFVISMVLLLIAGNFVMLFLGWELIGLTSFFLINFWTTRIATLKAAFKAFLFNRISDVALFLLIIFTYTLFNTTTHTNVIEFFSDAVYMQNTSGSICLNIFVFLIVVPAFIKSAQLFFYIWLPDSMEAPVPASALIHSATLVSAGIYLVLRFKPILILSPYALYLISIVGALTALLGAVASAYQTDTKRILAYSTISHCGFLMVSTMICANEFTILYLFVHGFAKAISFFCVGNVIRFNSGSQDIRGMGGYFRYLVFEAFVLFVSLLYLAGIPFTFGFFMKHFLVASTVQSSPFYYFLFTLLFIAAVFGVIYCSKLYYGVFFGIKKSGKAIYDSTNREKFFWKSLFYGFYTNSTPGSIFAIFGLLFFGLLVCGSYLFCILNNFTNLGDCGSTTNTTNYDILIENTPKGLLYNFGILNLVILLVIFIVLCVSFVQIFRGYSVYWLLAYILCFFFFFFCFFNGFYFLFAYF